MRSRVPVAALLVAAWLAPTAGAARADRLWVTSAGFRDGGRIPDVYAYRGCAPAAANRSPQLAWHGLPAATRSIAVTLFDPDAPTGHGFWHWVMFDIPAGTQRLAAGAGYAHAATAPRAAVLGHIDFGGNEYGGPCPPVGDAPHHYVFTVRALDIAIVPGGTSATTGPQLLAAIEGHVLAQGKIVGRFSR